MRATTTAMALALLLGLAACGAGNVEAEAAPPPPPKGSLVLDFESDAADGRSADEFTNRGTAPVDVVVATRGSADLVGETGPTGGQAVRFPRYTGADSAPAAVLVATSEDSSALSPGKANFEFGASFSLDRTSSGSRSDDGDNLVQRGAYGDPGQFKLQVDKGVPSCRIAGSSGNVFVKSTEAIERGTWYSVTCARIGSQVRLKVTSFADGTTTTSTASGSIGTIALTTQPLSVGGKVSRKGVPVASTDQFSGAVDDVFLRIG